MKTFRVASVEGGDWVHRKGPSGFGYSMTKEVTWHVMAGTITVYRTGDRGRAWDLCGRLNNLIQDQCIVFEPQVDGTGGHRIGVLGLGGLRDRFSPTLLDPCKSAEHCAEVCSKLNDFVTYEPSCTHEYHRSNTP